MDASVTERLAVSRTRRLRQSSIDIQAFYFGSIPIVRNHVSTSSGHRVIGNFVRPQPEGVPALRVQMHFHRNPGVLQRDVINQRVVDAVHVIILGLQQKGRRRLAGDGNSLDSTQIFGLDPEMPGIKSDREIRTAAFLVGGIDSGYRRFSKCVLIAATRCPPAENPSTPILCGSICHSAAGSGPAPPSSAHLPAPSALSDMAPIAARSPSPRHAVLQQHARDPLRRQPVTDLRAFEIDRQNPNSPPPGNTTTAAPVFFPFGE